jgi:acetolactate synthase-1/2/3 large subunit
VAGSALAAVAEAAATSIRPLLIAGGGSVGAAEQLTGLAELLDAPVLTTTLGKGVIDENHPLALGEFAAYSSATGIVGDADLVIAVGTELANPAVFAGFTGTLVRVDLDGSQVQKNVPAGIPIVSDAAEFARAALAVLDRRPAAREPGAERAALARERLARALPASVTRWRGLQRALEAGLPDDVIVTGDSSRVSYLGTGPHWRFARPRHYLVTTGYSTLGYALPAAIGAALANPDAPVLALMGDGAFLFSAQELLTAADDELPLAVVVVDSHGYQEIEDNMRDAALEPFAVSLLQPDYASLAAAMRADFAQPTTIAGLLECVLDALDGTRPTLIVFESTDHNLAG